MALVNSFSACGGSGECGQCGGTETADGEEGSVRGDCPGIKNRSFFYIIVSIMKSCVA